MIYRLEEMIYVTGDGSVLVLIHQNQLNEVIKLGWREATEAETKRYAEKLIRWQKETIQAFNNYQAKG